VTVTTAGNGKRYNRRVSEAATMALSREDRAYLEGLGVENVRQRLAYAGPGGLDVAPPWAVLALR
jgi:hypothetical protein